MMETAGFIETMTDIATLGAASEIMLVDEMILDGTDPGDAQDRAMITAPEIIRLMNASNDPVWTHVHEAIAALEAYVRKAETNRESVMAYASEEYMTFNNQALEVARDLLERSQNLLHPMYNNAERYSASVDPVEEITRKAQELAGQNAQ